MATYARGLTSQAVNLTHTTHWSECLMYYVANACSNRNLCNWRVEGIWSHAEALQEPRNKYAAHNDARTYMAATKEDVTFYGQEVRVHRNESEADDEPPQYLQYTKAKIFDIGSWEENEAFLERLADAVVLLEQCFGVQATRPQRMMTEGDVRTVATALKIMQGTEPTPP